MIESWRSKYLPPYFGNQDIEPSNHRCSLNARSIAASSSSHQELAFRLTWLATKPPSPTQSSSIFTTLALRSFLEDLRCRCFCSQSFAHRKPTICGCSLDASCHRSPLRFELSRQALASRLTWQNKQNPSPAHLASRFTTLRFVLSLQASTADFACLLFVRTMEPLFAFHGLCSRDGYQLFAGAPSMLRAIALRFTSSSPGNRSHLGSLCSRRSIHPLLILQVDNLAPLVISLQACAADASAHSRSHIGTIICFSWGCVCTLGKI